MVRPYLDGLLEPLSKATQEDEADLYSESDSEDIIIPLLDLNTTTSPHPAPSPPPVQTLLRDGELDMIHTCLVKRRADGSLDYDIDNGISESISHDSALYKCGGLAVRVAVSTSYFMDLMLCFDERCIFCSSVFGPEETDNDRRLVAEVEEARDAEIEDVECPGITFVHAKDLRTKDGAWVFEPGSRDKVFRQGGRSLGLEMDVLFPRLEGEMRVRCVLCADNCKECKEVRELQLQESARQAVAEESGVKRGKGKEPERATIERSIDSAVELDNQPAYGTPRRSEQVGYVPQQQPSHAKWGDHPIIWNSQILVDDEGNVYRQYQSPYSPRL